MQKLTTEQFITKAQAVHGLGKYDYSKTVYTGRHESLSIICPQHGLFEQRAGNHLNGNGCAECAGVSQSQFLQHITTADFIAKAQAVHGVGLYSYVQSIYTGSKNKVRIGCPQHGIFEQSPMGHLNQKQGCPACGQIRANTAKHLTQAGFIAKAQATHGLSKYDYSRTVYINSDNKVSIICPHHGVFQQNPCDHTISRAGCPRCKSAAVSKRFLSTLDEFIGKAHAVHGLGKYDYSQAVYISSAKKIQLTCPIHGAFKQSPNSHLSGRGCPKCGDILRNEAAKLDWVERANGRLGMLYFIRLFDVHESFYKVGVTYLSVQKRYGQQKLLNGYQYEILAEHKSKNVASVWDWEKSILETFTHLRYRPKRPFGGETECFSSADEILAIFPL